MFDMGQIKHPVSNAHEIVGWKNCANLKCGRELGHEFVMMVTTGHVYRFCSPDCLTRGQDAWYKYLHKVVDLESEYEDRKIWRDLEARGQLS